MIRNPTVAGILTGIKHGTERHNLRWHKKNEKMTIEDLLPVECNLLFQHKTKTDKNKQPLDKLQGKKGERPNYQLIIQEQPVDKERYEEAIPETLKDEDFYKYVKK